MRASRDLNHKDSFWTLQRSDERVRSEQPTAGLTYRDIVDDGRSKIADLLSQALQLAKARWAIMWLVERYLIAPRHSILNCIKTRRRPHYTHAFKALITQHDTHTRARCGINVRQPVSCYLLWSKKQTSLGNLELISLLKSKCCSRKR